VDQELKEPEEKDEDQLKRFETDLEGDELITFMEANKTPFEVDNDFTLTKNGVMKLINEIMDVEESEEEAKNWDVKMNKPEIIVKIKKAGHFFNKDVPYVYTKAKFNSAHVMGHVVQTLHNVPIRRTWDKNLAEIERTPVGPKGVLSTF